MDVAEWVQRGYAHQQAGQLVEAADAYRAALGISPTDLSAMVNLGGVLCGLGRWGDAVVCFERATRIAPDLPAAQLNLGHALAQVGRYHEAVARLRRTVARWPGEWMARFNLASALRDAGDLDGACAEFARVAEQCPDNAEVHFNLGSLWSRQQFYGRAVAGLRRAVGLSPQHWRAWQNLGVALLFQGRPDEAIEAFRRVPPDAPEGLVAANNAVYAAHFSARYDRAALAGVLREWAERFAAPWVSGSLAAERWSNDATPGRRLRIGYLSPDLRQHVVAWTVEPFLARHDHAAHEVYAYNSAEPARADAVTARLRGYFDHWRDVAGLSDDAVAARIGDDRIDVLVDLSLHMSDLRPLVLARRAAPVHVTHIGYASSTGMSTVDWRATDARLDPPGAAPLGPERLLYLPTQFWAYGPAGDAPPPAVAPPCVAAGRVTFGCLNNSTKILGEAVEAWSRILRAVPGSSIVMVGDADAAGRADRVEDFGRHGIAADRVRLVPKQGRADYLAEYARIDVALDPFPYAGGITTCDALWMGVPVVTLAGDTPVARAGVSILGVVGCGELVAGTLDAYVSLAIGLAGDVERLGAYRVALPAQIRGSSLLDHAGYTREWEAALRRAWTEWCGRRHEFLSGAPSIH